MKRILKIALGGMLILGVIAFWQRQEIRIWWLMQKVESVVEGERLAAVEQLASMDSPPLDRLLDLWTRDQAELCDAVAEGLSPRCDHWPEGDARREALIAGFLARQGRFSPSGHYAALTLLPKLLQDAPADRAEKFRPHVIAALSHSDATVRARAVVLAQRDDINALEAIVPLLKDEAAAVRRAAMLAVGPAPTEGEPLLGTEELLPWLHDPDPGVRRNCQIALGTRGLSPAEIQLSRRITDANPAERLKALIEFPDDEEFRVDPWLERLSRDRDSAVRAGAARVAVEKGVDFDERLREMTQTDPDQSVRKIAEHYRNRK